MALFYIIHLERMTAFVQMYLMVLYA